ncbi:MAG: hypothetical protein IPK72_11820 [Candidatus Eisenbacteria bacterium]|nr:hypothetical protein [Candidatus Eisenbacteria bacterium]
MVIAGSATIYMTAISIGMLHGVEPGHGWPIAAVFALNHRRRWWYGVWAAIILAGAHLISSFALVALYTLANRFFKLDGLPGLNIVAGGLLLLMAVHQWRSQGHGHGHGHGHAHESVAAGSGPTESAPGRKEELAKGGLLGLAAFAFLLGFAHEEEFAILALSAGKASAWAVMSVYALAVAGSLILLTCLAIATLNRFEPQFRAHEKRLPRISAAILGLMGVIYILGWM